MEKMPMSEHMDTRISLLLMAARMVGDYLYSWGGEEADKGESIILPSTPRKYRR
jgi:hypothetical protein